MASDAVWILGITMTKFGKHPDRDTIDLASEATMGALADGGVTMGDIDVMAAGSLMARRRRSRCCRRSPMRWVRRSRCCSMAASDRART